MENKSWSFKQFLLLGVSALIIYLVLFTKWLGVNLFYSTFSTTLLKIGKVASNLTDYCDSGPVTAIVLLIYGLLIVGAFLFWVTISSLFSAHAKGEDFSKAGFVFAILLPALILIFTLIINAIISSETDGYVDSLFTVEAPAYITLALGVAGCLICDKLSDTFLASAGSSASSFVQNTAGKVVSFVAENAAAAANDTTTPKSAASESTASAEPKAQVRKCVNCGWTTENGEVRFCAYCGTKLATELYCPNCGKKLEPDMKFCPYCAAEIARNA